MGETDTDQVDRLLTSREIGAVVAALRYDRGWTQETLAEIARVTVRTVQRVERGEPSSTDTRRALAGALEFQVLDAFNMPWPLPDYERIKAEHERLLHESVEVEIKLVANGRQLREFAEAAEGWQHSQLVDMTPSADAALATLRDYFQDYGDVHDCYSETQKLGVNADFQELIDTLAAEGIGLCAGTRRVRIGGFADDGAIRATLVHLVASSLDDLPRAIRVRRNASITW
jgi:transcriptional regulator with XRE-family HTH domain